MAEMNGQGELSLSRLLMDLHVDDAPSERLVSELHLPMPTFRLSDEQWHAVISYMLSLMELPQADIPRCRRSARSTSGHRPLFSFSVGRLRSRTQLCMKEGDWTCVSHGTIGLLARMQA
jgi:hypothetical protein